MYVRTSRPDLSAVSYPLSCLAIASATSHPEGSEGRPSTDVRSDEGSAKPPCFPSPSLPPCPASIPQLHSRSARVGMTCAGHVVGMYMCSARTRTLVDIMHVVGRTSYPIPSRAGIIHCAPSTAHRSKRPCRHLQPPSAHLPAVCALCTRASDSRRRAARVVGGACASMRRAWVLVGSGVRSRAGYRYRRFQGSRRAVERVGRSIGWCMVHGVWCMAHIARWGRYVGLRAGRRGNEPASGGEGRT
ncbi:hypothetical protein FKP32DRAFT_325034 [Trametes sanguinea]|nr:hypothetical protein FKP32DRAFT_325034 [Trametes sanguinea]